MQEQSHAHGAMDTSAGLNYVGQDRRGALDLRSIHIPRNFALLELLKTFTKKMMIMPG
jgi:hypothetical protein